MTSLIFQNCFRIDYIVFIYVGIYASNYCLVKDPTADSGNVYAPLNIPDGQNIYEHKPTKPVYNVLDNSASRSEAPLQSGPVGIEQPVYNILEKLPNHQEDTLQSGPVSIEQPVYNILEELPIDRENTPFGTEPVYNVLEANGQGDAESSGDNGSLPSEGKIHNPLEGTKHVEDCNVKRDNEPVYNVLEQDHYQNAY